MRTTIANGLLLLGGGLALVSATACSSGADESDAATGGTTGYATGTPSAGGNPYSLPGDETQPTAPDGDHATGGPRFPGAGTSGAAAPLQPGAGPETADNCSGGGPPPDGFFGVAVGDVATLCFYDPEAPEVPGATIEQVVEVVAGVEYVHIRLTLDPRFADNSYGENAIGWDDGKKGKHEFRDLVGSDRAEMMLLDGDDEVALHFSLDYISEDESSPSGYATQGVTGGDGRMIVGEESDVLGVATSIDRNLNGCGLDTYTESSPSTDASYTILDPEAADWDFRVVYEVWVRTSAFGDAGVGQAIIEFIHASPSKGEDNTVEVEPGNCPPDWGCYSPVSAEGKCL